MQYLNISICNAYTFTGVLSTSINKCDLVVVGDCTLQCSGAFLDFGLRNYSWSAWRKFMGCQESNPGWSVQVKLPICCVTALASKCNVLRLSLCCF